MSKRLIKFDNFHSLAFITFAGSLCLRILVSNSQSTFYNRPQFIEAVDYLNPDVVIGTESWLSKDIKSSTMFPHNFQKNYHRKDRNRNGRGVLITCKDQSEPCSLEDSDVNCEIIWTEIQTRTKNIIVGSYYRPPPKCKYNK